MITQARLLLTSLLAVAGVLTFLKIPLASSQGVTVVAAKVSGVLPVDNLDSALWQEPTVVEIPLSAQIVAKPMFSEARVRALRARAIYNDEQVGFLLEWQDDSLDDGTVRVQDFSDAVAIQFPLMEGQPFFCMGQQGGNVNIWHWKADWQAAMTTPQDVDGVYPNMYVDGYTFADEAAGAASSVTDYEDINYVPALAAGNLFAQATYESPVEDLIAGSFGSLTSQPAEMQNVTGHGEYVDGTWRVVLVRDLASPEEHDAHFETGRVYSMAFAAWDGANEERNGQKSTSQWVSLELGGEGGVSAPSAAPEEPGSGTRGPSVNTLEGLPFAFLPMFACVVLGVLMGSGTIILSRLLGKKQS